MAKQTPVNQNSSLALYEDFDLGELAKDREESKKANTGKMLGKLAEGKTVLRMGPPRPGNKTPWKCVYMHYVDVPGVEFSVSFVCPRMEAKLPCRVCTKARQMQASTNPVDQARGKKLLPKRDAYANVIRRASPEDGWKIWRFGKTILEQLQDERDPELGAGVNYTHPVQGYDLIVIRKGKGQMDTEYKVSVDPKGSTPLLSDNAAMTDLLKQMHNLDTLSAVPNDQEIQDLLAGKRPTRDGNTQHRGESQRGRTASDVIDGEGTVVDDEVED